jgi:hypothetical protein
MPEDHRAEGFLRRDPLLDKSERVAFVGLRAGL